MQEKSLKRLYTVAGNIVELNGAMMSAKIESHKKNPLLHREEAWIVVEHSGKPTPKRAELIDEAAKVLKADKELVIVDKIYSKEGAAASRARVYAYSKKEDMPVQKVEKMKRRLGLAKPATPEGAQAAPSS
jgi:ribosomal protein S24E